MQFAATIGTQAYDVTCIRWDLWLIEYDMKHPTLLTEDYMKVHEQQ